MSTDKIKMLSGEEKLSKIEMRQQWIQTRRAMREILETVEPTSFSFVGDDTIDDYTIKFLQVLSRDNLSVQNTPKNTTSESQQNQGVKSSDLGCQEIMFSEKLSLSI